MRGVETATMLLSKLAALQPCKPAATQPAVHSWRFTYTTCIFPEGRCPWCRGDDNQPTVIQSNRVWMVDESRQRLVGQLAAQGERLVFEQPNHPHVRNEMGGAICTGDTFNLATALFTAITPLDTFWMRGPKPVGKWLTQLWDHSCAAEPDWDSMVTCRRCEHLVNRDYARAVCSDGCCWQCNECDEPDDDEPEPDDARDIDSTDIDF